MEKETRMQAQIKLGRLFGVQIGLHYTWFLIALLITFSLAGHWRAMHAEWGPGLVWTMAIVTGLLFFAALIAHELAHALVARARGLPVHSITLFALGGVAQIEQEATDASTEFWMGIAGPIMSALIGGVCLGLAGVIGWSPWTEPATPILAMLVWLGYINLGLALFNMIPGFPMDGGRVLRAIVWWITGNAARATRIASLTGQVLAFGFIVLGLLRFFGGAGFGGVWIAFIGWFLLSAARASYTEMALRERVRGVRVGEIMTRECPLVDGQITLQTFVEEHLLRTGGRCFLVADNGTIAGLLTPHEVKAVERARWPVTTVYDVMRPLAQLRTVTPDTPVADALEMIGHDDVNQLPVIAHGRPAGMISRERILRYLLTRAELNM
jgi:Zn-dependent protease/predicted transcriptional regulator